MSFDDHLREVLRRGCCDLRIAKRLAARLVANDNELPVDVAPIRRQFIMHPEMHGQFFRDVSKDEARDNWLVVKASARFERSPHLAYHSAAQACIDSSSEAVQPVAYDDELPMETPDKEKAAIDMRRLQKRTAMRIDRMMRDFGFHKR